MVVEQNLITKDNYKDLDWVNFTEVKEIVVKTMDNFSHFNKIHSIGNYTAIQLIILLEKINT